MTNDANQHAFWESDQGHRQHNHPVVKTFAQQRVNYIRQWLDLSHIRNALDVGCGNGFSTQAMQAYISNVIGVDYSQFMLSRHPSRSRLALADALHLPFPDNTFDLVYGWEVLHHIYDPGQVVVEMARVSQRYVLLAEPNRNNPAQFAFALADPEHRWVLRYNLAYMRDLLETANLQLNHASRGGWLFPNVTPLWLLTVIRKIPYQFPLGISNWVLGEK